MRGGRSSSGAGGAQLPPPPPFPFGGPPFRCAPFEAAIRGSAAPAPYLSTGCTNGCENVEKGKVRKLRPRPVRQGCTAPCASLECRLRRARSASRSKPNLKAVREGRKAKAEGQ